MICAPGSGARSKLPKGVCLTDGLLRSVANAGRSVKRESALLSKPLMILNGASVEAISSGKKLIPQRVSTEPVKVNRCRTSSDERPYSVLRLYESEGKVPAPSVSPLALPNV